MSNPKNQARPPVIPLFKYMDPQFVSDALEGRFKVGTLHEYRDAEKYPGEQLDRGEGSMNYSGSIGEYSSDAGHAPPPLVESLFGVSLANSKNVKVNHVVFENCVAESENLYIFCSSHQFNPEIYHRSIYGAAVLISDGYAFCKAMTETLAQNGFTPSRRVQVGQIRYRDRKTQFLYDKGEIASDLNVPPYFVKPKIKRHEEEFEMRFAWQISTLREPLIIHCPEAAQYVSEIIPNDTSSVADASRNSTVGLSTNTGDSNQ